MWHRNKMAYNMEIKRVTSFDFIKQITFNNYTCESDNHGFANLIGVLVITCTVTAILHTIRKTNY